MKRPVLSFYAPLIFLGLFLLVSLFADYLAPYGAGEGDRRQPFHPPVRIHFWNEQGQFQGPFVYKSVMHMNEYYQRIYEEDKTRCYPVRFFQKRFFGAAAPARLYLMGTDSRGRDIFSRILYGARISFAIGFLGAFIAGFLGWFLGSVSGYFGGRLDTILMRLAEFFIMIPAFYFLLALRSALPPEMGSGQVFLLIVAVLSVIGWGGIARVTRGMVLSLRERDFVLAARVLGRSHFEILIRHIFPHTFSYLAVILSVSIPSYILTESGLSILGLGIQEPEISLGSLLSESLFVAHIQLHPWILWPGAAIFMVALSFNALGDALRERVAQV